MTTVYEAALTLKTVCDGARSEDGMGYNKFDAKKVDKIFREERNSEIEYILFNTIKKYKRQLSILGCIEDSIEELEFEFYNKEDKEKVEEKIETDIILEKNKGKIIVKFDYNSDIVDIMRGLPNRKYNPKTKNWNTPATKKNLELLKKKFSGYNVYIDSSVNNIKKERTVKNKKKENNKPNPTVTLKFDSPKKLKIYEQVIKVKFKYNPNYVEAIKELPIRVWDKNNKNWEVPIFFEDDVKDIFKNEIIKIVGEKQDIIKDNEDYSFVTVTEPYKHQKEALEYGKEYKKFLLADEQGLGKTKVAIDLAVSRREAGLIDYCLIICGVNSLKHNWVEEIKKHSNENCRILGSYFTSNGNYRDGSVAERTEELSNVGNNNKLNDEPFFYITNIETMRDNDFQEVLKEKTNNGIIGMTVIDEIHKAKNPETGKLSQQAKGIHSSKSEYKLALTGTPILNSPIEFYNILKWLEVESRNFYQFRNRYAQMGGYGGYEVTGYKNLKELEELQDLVRLRRKKTNVLDLPEKVRTAEYVTMTSKQRQIYNEVQSSIIQNIDKVKTSPNPLSTLTRLRQATTNPAILSSKINKNPKFERIKEIVEERSENNDKVIVFSNWTKVIDPLYEELKAEGYNPAIITGDIKNRQEQVNKFQQNDSCKVIVGTIGAMGTGLTLTAGTTVIFTDKPWNMANQEQAEDRAHRIGTKNTVNIISLIAKNTIDERVEALIKEKDKYVKGLVDKETQIRILLGLEDMEDYKKEVI
ncbi:MAG: SNF2-related protein [Atribacterota bacterium]